MQKNTVVLYSSVSFLNDNELFLRAYNTVSEQRRIKTDKLKLKGDKMLSLCAELLLIAALNDKGINYIDVKINRNNAKPYIEDKDIYFNISHSGEYAICAVSYENIGCDIEKISDFNIKTAEKFFSKKETDIIKSELDYDKRKELFYRFWTAKESYVKYLGTGLKTPFDSFCADLEKQIIKNTDVKIKEFSGIDGYKCTVCGKDLQNITLKKCDLEELLLKK